MATQGGGVIDLRLRSWIPDEELEAKKGKILTPGDYNLLLTGPAKVRKADGSPLCVYVPGVLAQLLGGAYPVLHGLRSIQTDNRGLASGSGRERRGDQARTRSRRVRSAIIGAVDPGGQQRYCRLTAWTGEHVPEWEQLRPLLQEVTRLFAQLVPERYAVQAAAAAATRPEWVVPGTPFTTLTVNNTYATGVHQDAGDLAEGFSTLAVCRRGSYSGGVLVFPRWRVGVDMHDGDLLLMDAHEWHGNTDLEPHDEAAERISLVSYFRTKMQACGTTDEELAKAVEGADRRSGLG